MFGKIGLAETDQRTYEGVTLFGGVQFYDLFGDANVFVIVGPFLMLLDVDPDLISHLAPTGTGWPVCRFISRTP
jgi:hypothetical protein